MSVVEHVGYEMATGTVIRFDEIRGYGFVSPDVGGEDVFIHVNDLSFDKRLLSPGIQVEFVAEEGDRGLKASQIRLYDQSKPAAAAAQPTSAAVAAGPPQTETDEMLCDVLSPSELALELTEALLSDVPSLTGAQIASVRQRMLTLAHSHGWVEE